MGKKIDLTGQRFGKLVVVKDVGRKNGTVLWECVCECGSHVNVISTNLQCGNSKSCGCARMKDLSNQQFGRLVVLNPTKKRTVGSVVWMCKCDCGSHVEVTANNLKSGNTKSCGCMRMRDLSGQRFGKLVVVNPTDKRSHGSVVWKCKCDCGNYTDVISENLLHGAVESCGCIRIENLEGIRYGKLIAIQKIQKGSHGSVVWMCKCDCGSHVEVKTNNLKSGNTKSCGCLKFEMVGDNNPNYNPNLTYEDRIKHRYELDGGSSRVWSKQVMERDAYTCQICNQYGVNLNAHHLNGWNAFPEQRFDLDNGATLCTDCHKEFHSQYGYGDNTREQFDEYAASKTLVLN